MAEEQILREKFPSLFQGFQGFATVFRAAILQTNHSIIFRTTCVILHLGAKVLAQTEWKFQNFSSLSDFT